jgi:hypothetical protein
MSLDRAVWFAWWVGTILIMLSYTKSVSSFFGWVGFAIAGISVLISVVVKKYWKIPPKDPEQKP